MKRVIAIYGRTALPDPKSPYYYQESYPWLKGEMILYLGEIEDMPGHGVFVRDDGKVYYGYHLDNFIPMKSSKGIKDEEIDEYNDFESEIRLATDPIDNKKYFCMSKTGIEKYKNNTLE